MRVTHTEVGQLGSKRVEKTTAEPKRRSLARRLALAPFKALLHILPDEQPAVRGDNPNLFF